MNTERIDVLAVMARPIGNTRTMAGLTGDPMMREHLREGEEARAAVIDLIEARNAMAPLCRAVVAARTEAEEIAACKALAKWLSDDMDAALARIGGAA